MKNKCVCVSVCFVLSRFAMPILSAVNLEQPCFVSYVFGKIIIKMYSNVSIQNWLTYLIINTSGMWFCLHGNSQLNDSEQTTWSFFLMVVKVHCCLSQHKHTICTNTHTYSQYLLFIKHKMTGNQSYFPLAWWIWHRLSWSHRNLFSAEVNLIYSDQLS